jgi:uncharacterized protein (TIGR01777 family)
MDHTVPPRVVITGGSGFLGLGLAAFLARAGVDVTIVSRSRPARGEWAHAEWDGRTVGGWGAALDGAAAVVNFAGRTVDCIKTPDHQDEILRSRVESTLALGRAMREVATPPPVWVQMSTAHIYGDPPTEVCDETSPTGHGLAPDVGRAWEAAHAESLLPGQRSVVLRTSFVVGRRNAGGAGALGKLGLLSRLGLGGTVGSGTQGMSWLHELDFWRIVERAIQTPSMTGAYVVSSPGPVSQREFARTLRRYAGGLGSLGVGLPAAAWMVRLGAPLVLRTDPELALYGRYVLPRRLLAEGFEFRFPTLEAALADLHTPSTSKREG